MGEDTASPSVLRAREILRRLSPAVSGETTLATSSDDDADLIETAIAVAGLLVTEANRRRTPAQDERLRMLDALMRDPRGLVFTTLLTDRAFRSQQASRLLDELAHLLRTVGMPRYLSLTERALLTTAHTVGRMIPRLAQQGILQKLREQTRAVIVAAEDPFLAAHLHKRAEAGVAVNVNHLGEAVLSEQDAQQRIAHYCALLQRSDVRTISVKVSSICSQLHLLAWHATLDRLCPRLHSIYATAIQHGHSGPKLVYLDMESYRDLHLTLAAFKRVLDMPDMRALSAGVVLQAYLPDSFALQQELTHWAMARVERGGAPIRLRIVKGANLAMESVESSLRGWPKPTFDTKHQADASYKRMVEYACKPKHARAVRVGIASHNAFDLAYAVALAHARGVEADVGYELLEGMADPLLEALNELTHNVLVYAPVVEDEAIASAIAYLIRRLDENTAPENFLRHSFALRTNSAAWVEQERRFRESYAERRFVSDKPRRLQDRRTPPERIHADAPFANEADTDFSLTHNREWLCDALEQLRTRDALGFGSQIAGEDMNEGETHVGFDPSRPDHHAYTCALASALHVERALDAATSGARQWAHTSIEERDRVLHAAAHELRTRRGDLIAAMVLDAGKAVLEGDVEVSEAIDFAEYYRLGARELFARDDVSCAPKGVVLVTPPWNFPLAIAAGGVLAALATGNAVILKPALETAFVARCLCEALWSAGVPRSVLQLVICEDDVASTLVKDARVNTVVLTGSSETARLFRRMRPGLDLLAETGGKNAIVISAMCDWDLAIKDLVQSAFGHSGQKCSAASLAICEAEVYDSPEFQRRLREAAESLLVGSAWKLDSTVTPLVQLPGSTLQRGLSRLDDDEAWLLQPRVDPDNPRLWSPGIRLGVQSGTFCHQTELFGPVLGVMRANDLDHAIALANDTDYGLTSGLFSLDEREQQRWRERIVAGNLYINRGTTGAIVRRQPFGGTKASSFGPGAKAGGPGYLAQLVTLSSRHAQPDYAAAYGAHFAMPEDPSQVLGQDNVFSYVRCEKLCVLVTASAQLIDVERVLAALAVCDHTVEIATLDAPTPCVAAIRARRRHQHTDHSADTLVAHLRARDFQRIRVIGDAPSELLAASDKLDAHIERSEVSTSGRVELAKYLRERSLSFSYHRYGNLSRIT